MQNLFANLNVNVENVENTNQDYITRDNTVLESNVYKATISMAYQTESKGGALGLVVKFLIKDNGQEIPFTQTLWITNKSKEITYTSKDGKKHYLKGFLDANNLAKHLVGKDLMQLSCKEMQTSIYDRNVGKEVATMVVGYPELTGKKLAVGIIKTRENKLSLVGTSYEPTNEPVFRNTLDKLFFIKANQLFTATELENKELEEPKFLEKWLEKWENQVQDKFVETVKATSNTTTKLEFA